MKIQKNLQFWVDKIKEGTPFSMARWGDGELYCMWGKRGANSNGCKYLPELRTALLDAMEPKEGFIHGLQCVLPQDEERIVREHPFVQWYDTEEISKAVAEGRLYPLIEVIQSFGIDATFIGNQSIRPFVAKVFPDAKFIQVEPSNAYRERESVLHQLKIHGVSNRKRLYLFSCGMAANAFIYEMHGNLDGFLLDVGHIWDPFTGLMSRCDLEGKTLEEINKNLKPCE